VIRIQTTINLGCEQIERIIEVDDISTLSAEERELLIDLATGPLSFKREEDGEPIEDTLAMSAASIFAMSAMGGKISVPDKPAYPSYTQNLVEHGLFEKEFRIKHKLEAIRVLQDIEGYSSYMDILAASLMEDFGYEVQKGEENA
jgi:hypothetical protein